MKGERDREKNILMIPSGRDETAKRNITVRCSWLSSALSVFNKANIYLYRQSCGYSVLICGVTPGCFCDDFICFWRNSPQWAMTSSFTKFLDHTQRRTTVGRTPPDECSARRRDLYLTAHNTHNSHTSILQWDSNPPSQQTSGRRPTP